MRSGELIDKLNQFPADTEVVVSGYEYGLISVSEVSLVEIEKDFYPASEYWAGPHRERDTFIDEDNKDWTLAIRIESSRW